MSASRSLPLVDRYVSAVWVVGGEHLFNDLEEVKQSALLKRELNRGLGIAFTHSIILNMRMSDAVVGTCLVRINGNDRVVTALGKRLQVQFNPEATKIEVFQVNSFGNGRKDLALGIKTNVIELLHQCHQIEKDVTGFDGWLLCHF